MCPISLLCRIHYNYKDYTCSVCGSSCAVCQGRCRTKKKGRRKKPSAGHHFHWQLVNKLKKRDAGTIFLPLFSSLSLSFPPAPLLLSTTGAFPKNLLGSDGLFRCWNWLEEIYHSRVQRFSPPFHSIHTFFSSHSPPLLFFNRLEGFTGMESCWINHERLVAYMYFLLTWSRVLDTWQNILNFNRIKLQIFNGIGDVIDHQLSLSELWILVVKDKSWAEQLLGIHFGKKMLLILFSSFYQTIPNNHYMYLIPEIHILMWFSFFLLWLCTHHICTVFWLILSSGINSQAALRPARPAGQRFWSTLSPGL